MSFCSIFTHFCFAPFFIPFLFAPFLFSPCSMVKDRYFARCEDEERGLFELLEKHFPGQSLPGVSVAGSCSGQEARVAGNFYEDAAGLALHPGSATAALPCSERPCSNSPRERESRSPADNILSSDG